jgi:hypothetical protein
LALDYKSTEELSKILETKKKKQSMSGKRTVGISSKSPSRMLFHKCEGIN